MREAIVLWAVTGLVFAYGWLAATAAWIERPAVVWDPYTGRWRSARLLAWEQGRRLAEWEAAW